MFLDNTTSNLVAVLGAAKTTNDFHITGRYTDTINVKTTYAKIMGVTNGTTQVTALGAPAGNTLRKILELSFYNADTAAKVLTVGILDGSTLRNIISQSIPAGAALMYHHRSGWGGTFVLS